MKVLFWALILMTAPLISLMALLVWSSFASSRFFLNGNIEACNNSNGNAQLRVSFQSKKERPQEAINKSYVPFEEITVLLPFHNNEDTIETTVDRVLLNSKLIPLNLIVINNRSSDRTEGILRKYFEKEQSIRVTFLSYSETSSKARALAEGLNLVSTELVALIDADIMLDSTALFRLVKHLKLTSSDVVSGFVLFDSIMVRNMAAWDKCLSHGTIRLGRSKLGLSPSIPGQVVLARRAVLSNYGRFHSFLEDLALSNAMYAYGLQVKILPELVARESYPDNIGFLWKQRTRWLIGNLEAIPQTFRSLSRLNWKGRLGILIHLPIYHMFPILVPVWILFSIFRPWPSLIVVALATGLYALAAWNGARNTGSQGTISSLLLFVGVFPWIHLLAWIIGVPMYLLEKLFGTDIYSFSVFHRRRK